MKSTQDIPTSRTPDDPVGPRDGLGDIRGERSPLWDAEYLNPSAIPVLRQARSELLAFIEFGAPRESWHRLTSLVTMLLQIAEANWQDTRRAPAPLSSNAPHGMSDAVVARLFEEAHAELDRAGIDRCLDRLQEKEASIAARIAVLAARRDRHALQVAEYVAGRAIIPRALSSRYAVYVAASTQEPDRAAWAMAKLREAGVDVTSTWLEVVGKVGANPQASYADRREWAARDLAEIARADLLWFLVPTPPATTRGGWGEWLYAHALGREKVSSGKDLHQSVFLALGQECATDYDALAAIKVHATGCVRDP